MSELEYIETVEMPDWALSYLVNGDSSSLEQTEIDSIDALVDEYATDYGMGSLVYNYDEDTLGFSMRPWVGLAADCYTCSIYGHKVK